MASKVLPTKSTATSRSQQELTQSRFADRLNLGLAWADLTQRELAALAGLHYNTIGSYCKASYRFGPPRRRVRRVLAEMLGLPPDWFDGSDALPGKIIPPGTEFGKTGTQ